MVQTNYDWLPCCSSEGLWFVISRIYHLTTTHYLSYLSQIMFFLSNVTSQEEIRLIVSQLLLWKDIWSFLDFLLLSFTLLFFIDSLEQKCRSLKQMKCWRNKPPKEEQRNILYSTCNNSTVKRVLSNVCNKYVLHHRIPKLTF